VLEKECGWNINLASNEPIAFYRAKIQPNCVSMSIEVVLAATATEFASAKKLMTKLAVNCAR